MILLTFKKKNTYGFVDLKTILLFSPIFISSHFFGFNLFFF